MPADIIIWSATSHCWLSVTRPDPHGPIHFEPLADAMAGELARRALVSAMRLAAPAVSHLNGPSARDPAGGAWDD